MAAERLPPVVNHLLHSHLFIVNSYFIMHKEEPNPNIVAPVHNQMQLFYWCMENTFNRLVVYFAANIHCVFTAAWCTRFIWWHCTALHHKKSWGQPAVMQYGRYAWHAWRSWPNAWHTPGATVVCLCVCYWFNPERSGDAEVSTQQFRHFHPETRTHLCLSVSWGLWFHTRAHLFSHSLSLP